MSRLVDERVVQMTFDNAKFDSNIKQSINSVNDLKSSLNFDGVTDNINKDLRGVDTSVLASSIEEVGAKFSALEIAAITAISNITNRLIDMGIEMTKNLSVDNISAGWDKFADKTKAVGTILGQGYELDEVNKQLERLNWYTDQTSYDFTSMVNSIGKFTATGQKLDESVDAMMGIANWAALSGQNAETASRAMYQISQAMGAGSMRLIDYRSIQNANMDTDEFRQKVLDTAVEMGKLNKITSITGETLYETLSGQQFSKGQFTEKLSEGWFDKDVMMKTFRTYSDGIDDLYEYTKENGGSVETAFDEIGDTLDEFGMKAFKAAQEARTFMDAIIATKDAVGSSWMSTFEKVFGTYDEAVELWSNFSVKLWDIFAAGGEARNRALDIWKERGGRDDLFADTGVAETTGAFWNLIYALEEVINVVKEAWRAVFPFAEAAKDEYEGMAMRYKSITEWLQKFAANLRMNEERTEKLKGILKGFFATIKFGLKLLKAVWDGLKPLRDLFSEIVSQLTKGTGKIGDSFADFVDKTSLFETITKVIAGTLNKLIYIFKALGGIINNLTVKLTGFTFGELLLKIGDLIKKAVDKIQNAIMAFRQIDTKPLDDFDDETKEKLHPIKAFFEGIKNLFEGIWSVIKALLPVIGQVVKFIGDTLKAIGNLIKNAFDKKDANELLNFKNLFSAAFLASLTAIMVNLLSFTRSFAAAFRDIFQGFADVLDSKAMMQYAEALKTFAIAVLLMVASIILLSGIDEKKLATGIAALTAIIGLMVVVIKVMTNSFSADVTGDFLSSLKNIAKMVAKAKSMQYLAAAFLKMAVSIGIMALALKLLSTIKTEDITSGILGLTAIVALMIVASKMLSQNAKSPSKGIRGLLSMSIAMYILAGAIKKLSSISKEGIKNGLLTIAGVLAMTVLVGRLSKNMDGIKLVGLSVGIAALGVALTVMLGAFKILSLLDAGSIFKSIGVLSLLLVILTILSKGMSVMDGLKIGVFSAGMILLGIAFMNVGYAMKIIGGLKPDQFRQGALAILGMLAMLALISKFIGLFSAMKLPLFAIGIAMLGGAFMIMGRAIRQIGSTDRGVLDNGKDIVYKMTSMVLLISKFMTKGGAKKLMIFSADMVILGVAFNIIGVAIKNIGQLDGGTLAKGTIAILAILAFVSAISKVIGVVGAASLLIFATALTVLGDGLLVLGGAIAVLGNLKFTTLLKGLLAFAAVLALLAVAGVLLKPFAPSILLVSVSVLAMAAAMLLAATAITLLLTTLTMFSDSLGSILISVSEAIVEAAPAMANALTSITESALQALSNALDSIFLLLGNVIDKLLGLLNDKGPAIIDTVLSLLDKLLASLNEHFPSIVENIVSMLVTLMKAIKDHLGEIIDIVMDMIITLLEKLNERIPEIIDSVGNLIVTVVESAVAKIVEITPRLINAAFDLILGLIEGLGQALEDNAGKIRDTMISFGNHIINAFKKLFGINSPSTLFEGFGKNIVQGLINGIKDLITNVLDLIETIFNKIFNIVTKFINKSFTEGAKFIKELIKGMKSVVSELLQTINQWVRDILDIVGTLVDGMFDIGGRIMDGLYNGIKKGMTAPIDLIGDIGNSIKDGFCNLFGIHSPSRVFAEYGKFMDEGLAQGLKNNTGVITNSFQALGDAVETGIDKSGMSEAVASMVDNMDLTPDGTITITPVLDLSEIQNGTEQMNSMLKSGDYGIDASGELARKLSDEVNSRRFNNNRINEVSNKQQVNPATNQAGTMNITFNITGTNAKEIADEVSKVIQDQVTRRKLNWA